MRAVAAIGTPEQRQTNVIIALYQLQLSPRSKISENRSAAQIQQERRPCCQSCAFNENTPYGPLRAFRAPCDLRVLCACVPCCVLSASWLFVCRVCLRLHCLLLRATSTEVQSPPAISQSYQVRSVQPLRTPLQLPHPLSKPPVCVQDSPCVLRTPACGPANSTPQESNIKTSFLSFNTRH
ncbi:hypothetical protein Ae201684P_010808 [Aphanomyces euteiches]|nr:hypothetical protein Ae201684P_010808 [Aphanomyces euteiches]